MFFYPSKLFWLMAAPTNALVLLALFGSLLLFTRFARLGRWLGLGAAIGLLAMSAGPLGYWLMRPLEDRFPRPPLPEDVAGILVLGGAVGTTRGEITLNDAGARMAESVALALRFPNAKLIFTGGDGSLIEETDEREAPTEAEAARRFYIAMGIAADRIILEDRSRNTRENALFSKPIADRVLPRGGRLLLVTSAWHMPRSVGVFRRAGYDVIPFPVDYATRGVQADWVRLNRGFSHGLKLTDLAAKEWIGLAVYRIAGYTDALLPSP